MGEPEFLFSDWLGEAIRRVAAGSDLRLAVAYWSVPGVEALLAEDRRAAARVLCDLSDGLTSPEALRLLGAPDNGLLRHHPRLHAKTYISDQGPVTSSANASGAALGIGDPSRWRLETGSFHPAGSAAWRQAIEWFDAAHGRAGHVGEAELAWAEAIHRPPRRATHLQPRTGSLLDLVAAAPERFASTSFVVTGVRSDDRSIRAARRSATKLDTGIAKGDLEHWPRDGIFTGWRPREVRRQWQATFVEFWLGPRKVSVTGYRGQVFDHANGSVLAKRDWKAVTLAAGLTLPDRATIGRRDGDLARLLVGKGEGALFANGTALADALAEVRRLHPHFGAAWTADPSGESDPREGGDL